MIGIYKNRYESVLASLRYLTYYYYTKPADEFLEKQIINIFGKAFKLSENADQLGAVCSLADDLLKRKEITILAVKKEKFAVKLEKLVKVEEKEKYINENTMKIVETAKVLDSAPEGEVIGMLRPGMTILQTLRRGNWILCQSETFDSGWIASTAIGLKKIDLCSVNTYFQGNKYESKNIEYIKEILGEPDAEVSEAGYRKISYRESIKSLSVNSLIINCTEGNGAICDVTISFKINVCNFAHLLDVVNLPYKIPSNYAPGLTEWTNKYDGLKYVAANKYVEEESISGDCFRDITFSK